MVILPSISLRFLSILGLLFLSSGLQASTISGTVKDSSGAVIPHARLEIRGGALEQPVVTTSDEAGHFASPALKSGNYAVRVIPDGFETLERPVDLGANSAMLDFQLAVAAVKEEVTVAGKSARFANTDPTYRALRDAGLGAAFQVEGITVK